MNHNYGQHRPTWTEIDLKNLAHNFNIMRQILGDTKIMTVVKADAYGHGAVECARALEKCGTDWFGVAIPEEGVELRKAGISKMILCFDGFWIGQEDLLLNNEITPVIYQIEKAEALNAAAERHGCIARFHIKVDTGMGRVGVRFDEFPAFVESLKPLQNLRVEGVMTHFAAADDAQQNDFTNLQIRRFNEAVGMLESNGFHPIYRDLANSPASLAHPNARGNLVRLGGILYGLTGDMLQPKDLKLDFRPVLSLHSRINQIKRVPAGETLGYGRTFETTRESLIATIPIGYQDGFPRLASNRGRVLVNGKFAPIVGRVSMDWTIIDVTDIPETRSGDHVTIIGTDGNESISAVEIAKLAETISYEITCGINRRVDRHFV